jgi:nitrite reductase/ring-hydroxylating ferredoxin subunit
MSQTDWTKVATKDELPDGEMIGVNAGTLKVCLAQIDGKYYAVNDVCTHFATRLSSGELFSDELEVQCPLHDSKFSFVDGKPNQVPADKPVAVYEVKVVDDEIFVGPAK